jgi:NADH dehydrogenase
MTERPGAKIIIVGAGFGGLQAAHCLASEPVEITIIDRRNHHLFQPLLYQAATASLAPSEIAWPIRSLLSRYTNVKTLLGEVVGVDTHNRTVLLQREEPIPFDMLILATGARHAYFGHDEWEIYAPGLKTLEDTVSVRRRILWAFEQAEWQTEESVRAGFLTFVIVGAGPTGVEIAGTIAELAHDTLHNDFRNIDTRRTRVVLVEAGPRILPSFRESLSDYAQRALTKLGVEIELGQAVSGCDDAGVQIGDRFLPAKTVIWAAGVAASPVSQWLHTHSDRAGRVFVEPDLTVPGHPNIFVIGDAAHVEMSDGRLVPGVAPAAKQEGQYVAKTIKARRLERKPPPPFRYKDFGSLATIGKRAAIVDFGWLRLTGRLAWWMWGFTHIYFLIGLRNRLAVALSWLWIYVSGRRSARLITQAKEDE